MSVFELRFKTPAPMYALTLAPRLSISSNDDKALPGIDTDFSEEAESFLVFVAADVEEDDEADES